MKKLIVFALALASATTSMAGAGGYNTVNCVSASGRTMVSFFMSDFGGMSMNVIVDGKINTYDTEDKKNDITFAGNDDVIIAKKNNSIQVTLSGKGSNRELHILPGSDPRLGTEISYVAKNESQTIPVNCKSYTKEP